MERRRVQIRAMYIALGVLMALAVIATGACGYLHLLWQMAQKFQ